MPALFREGLLRHTRKVFSLPEGFYPLETQVNRFVYRVRRLKRPEGRAPRGSARTLPRPVPCNSVCHFGVFIGKLFWLNAGQDHYEQNQSRPAWGWIHRGHTP